MATRPATTPEAMPGTWLTVCDPLGEHPAQRSSSGSDLSNEHGHTGSAVGSSSGTSVEAEPADPQHGSTHQGVTQVMRGHRSSRVAFTLAQYQAGNQTSNTCVDVNHGAAGEVENTPVAQQRARTAPDHVRNRRIDDGEPEGHENQH